MKYSGKIGHGPLNNWLNFGGDLDLDHHLDTGLFSEFVTIWRHGKWYEPTALRDAAVHGNTACTSRHRHSNYDVIVSPAHDIQRD